MKKKSSTPKDIQKALDKFPSIVKKNRTDYLRKERFIEKTFGPLARKVYEEVHGKKAVRRKRYLGPM